MKIMHYYYILNEDKTVRPVTDVMEWATWFEKADRTVKRTELPGGILVSTVFLGLDHGFGESSLLVFETMIFGGEHDQYQNRYATYEEALKGHDKAIELVYSVTS